VVACGGLQEPAPSDGVENREKSRAEKI